MASIRELASFPLSPSMRQKLSKAGFRTVADILEMRPAGLASGM
jgi:hypothetical protein